MAEKTNRLKNKTSEKAEKAEKGSPEKNEPKTAVPKRERKRSVIPGFLKSEAFMRVTGLFLLIF